MPTKPAAPIDITTTDAWKALAAHYAELQEQGISLKDWFAADPDRVSKLSFDTSDLHFDLSKNLLTDKTVELLLDLCRAAGVEEDIIHATCSHGYGITVDIRPELEMEKVLFAVDALTGLWARWP